MQESSGIPRMTRIPPQRVPLSSFVHFVSLRAPITRRNAHLPRDGGLVMVSDHSKLLSSAGQKGGRILPLPSPPLFCSPHSHPEISPGRRIFNPTGNLTESTFRLKQRRRWSGGVFLRSPPPKETTTGLHFLSW